MAKFRGVNVNLPVQEHSLLVHSVILSQVAVLGANHWDIHRRRFIHTLLGGVLEHELCLSAIFAGAEAVFEPGVYDFRVEAASEVSVEGGVSLCWFLVCG